MWAKSLSGIAYASALILLIASSNIRAEVADGTSVVDLNEAITRTIERNPGLIAYGHQVQAQQGRVTQSGLKPNPTLALIVENFLGTDEFQARDGAETTASIAWVLERGKRQRRVDAASAGVLLAESEAEIQRLDAAAETGRHFLNCLGLQEHLTQTELAVTLAGQTAAAIARRVAGGRAPDADLARAQAQLARVRLHRDDVEHELQVSNRRLAAQWGASEPDFSHVFGNIRDLPRPEPFSTLLARIDETPNITRYLTEERLREAELRLAAAEAKPDWRVTAGIRHHERSGEVAFVTGISVPLSLHNRNQGRIAEAQAKVAFTNASRHAKRIKIETQLFAIYQELEHSVHRATALREKILPSLERALADTERAYDAGRYGYLELRVVQAELLDVRRSLIEAATDAHRNVIEIERLTGTVVKSPRSLP